MRLKHPPSNSANHIAMAAPRRLVLLHARPVQGRGLFPGFNASAGSSVRTAKLGECALWWLPTAATPYFLFTKWGQFTNNTPCEQVR